MTYQITSTATAAKISCVKYSFQQNCITYCLLPDHRFHGRSRKVWNKRRIARNRALRGKKGSGPGHKRVQSSQQPHYTKPRSQIRSTEITTVSRKSCGRACSRECEFECSCCTCLPRIIYRMGTSSIIESIIWRHLFSGEFTCKKTHILFF